MSYKAWFDKQDVIGESLEGKRFVRKDVLHFHLRSESSAGGQPYEFDGPAEEKHKTGYKAELEIFLNSGDKPKMVVSIDQVIEAEGAQAEPEDAPLELEVMGGDE